MRNFLQVFRNKIVEEKLLEKDKLSGLFANISSLYQFHNTHLLPALLESCREWQTSRKLFSGSLHRLKIHCLELSSLPDSLLL